jgi:hypothetical protein
MFLLRYLFGSALLWLSKKLLVACGLMLRRMWRFLPF